MKAVARCVKRLSDRVIYGCSCPAGKRGCSEWGVAIHEKEHPQCRKLRRSKVYRAFRMMKSMQAQGIDWGEDYRRAGAQALKEVLEGKMVARIDRHLEEMDRRREAGRRNGSYPRRLMTEPGEIELSVPRTRTYSALSAHPGKSQRAAKN